MLKLDLKLNENVRCASKKMAKKLTAMGFSATLCASLISPLAPTLTCAQDTPTSESNDTQVNISSQSDNCDVEIIKVLKEELNGCGKYDCNYLSMLSDNEIKYLYFEALQRATISGKIN